MPSLSFSEDTVTIESTGSSVISTDNAAFARDAAIAEALRKALDQAAGTFVSSGTLVEDYNEAAEFSRFLISRSGRYRITGATLNTIEVEGAE